MALSILCGCKALQESSKYQFNEGTYKVKTPAHTGKAYVVISEDSIKVYPLNVPVFDSLKFIDLSLPDKTARPIGGRHSFVTNSFDLDLLTILFKYRPSVYGFPNQFTTHLNGAAYVGYRSDAFSVLYSKKPLYYKRHIEHYGYSMGGFLGMGATAMNPWVTRNNITEEYDGFVISKGIALNIAVNAFTFGLAVGWDHLMDRNRKYWIYQGKVWTGVTLGLNLN
ncbi:hypothetical protein L3C95_09490 [Chitinophaga filiformis]|uniref:hypothetical protein n=1 Tax=Chitinophaga filiformis TaxID=104663 RepID=UPI001F3DB9C8|nr:hypothetical protein [Chitinophaga filiformis]MCF6403106.1 hypothetical protein [Chitinophaga filiformis]